MMISETETLQRILNRDFDQLLGKLEGDGSYVVKNKLGEIPNSFYEPTIAIDEEGKNKISLLQFSLETVGMGTEKKNGLMEKYGIHPQDVKKLDNVVESIRVATEYGNEPPKRTLKRGKTGVYGFSLASHMQLDQAYPLWVAYLCADALYPLEAVKDKLKEDGVENRYHPEAIVGLIEHANQMMEGKSVEEKKDFFMHSISDILKDYPEETHKKENQFYAER